MIPRLQASEQADPLVLAFRAALLAESFGGDISLSGADRTVFSSDNSIYQIEPAGVLFPRGTADLVAIARILARPEFRTVTVAARGGGTGTNGQSLTHGLVVDLSRHMNAILGIDVAARRVRVQAGVVKDQLNAALKPHGLFFAPELSTSNRATIGGMISTDACGQGSCLYGKTRDHVRALTTVLAGGTVWTSRPLGRDEFQDAQAQPGRVGKVHRLLDTIAQRDAALIETVYPPLNRSLTGYDLPHLRDGSGRFDLNSVLCGSEGTLGFIAEADLAVLPIPARAALINVRYRDFDAALRDARHLAPLRPASIETIDGRVLGLARGDMIWAAVENFFPVDAEGPAEGILIIEVVGDLEDAIDADLDRILGVLGEDWQAAGRLGWTIVRDPKGIESVWSMRKRAVGLLGNSQGSARPIPFVEDTAVPPEQLADFIAEFRAILDGHGLSYGMFGHADAGVLHVRPAIDLLDRGKEPLIREISDAVVALRKRYGGVLWGEHGKGLRSAYAPTFFGPVYPLLQQVKAAFDPFNQYNPGKVAAPPGMELIAVDAAPLRAARDRQIDAAARDAFSDTIHCNGNGACHNFETDHVMCPSWKGTRERRHSPKGRSALMREWLRRLAAAGIEPVAEAARLRAAPPWRGWSRRLANSWGLWRGRNDDFSHEVRQAMDGCLACKGCSGTCPIKVDVPGFRARFLELYYGRYLRHPRDLVVASVERMAPLIGRMPGLARLAIGNPLARYLTGRLGLVAIPLPSPISLRPALRAAGVACAEAAALAALSPAEKMRSVVLVQDAFTSLYEADLVIDLARLLQALGYRVWIAPFMPNGKPLHVHGFLEAFEKAAHRNAAMLRGLAATGVELVGVDPSMTLVYRSEYKAVANLGSLPAIALPQEWLARRLDSLPRLPRAEGGFRLLPHCSERALAGRSLADWQAVFDALGAELRILEAGCCGMAGTFGHMAEKRPLSEAIYRLSWAEKVDAFADGGRLLATGYSCRSQVKAVEGRRIMHPVTALLDLVTRGQSTEWSESTSI